MALVHECLYQSKDLAKINFNEYIRNLTDSLFHAYEVNSTTIKPSIDVDDISLGVTAAIPCGLIINELVSNSLKHAFPGGGPGEISIELRAIDDDQAKLRVRDNGVGFPINQDFSRLDSLGLQLISTLTEQLGGTIELHNNGGTEFEITFPQVQANNHG